jgi:hypothetical protein
LAHLGKQLLPERFALVLVNPFAKVAELSLTRLTEASVPGILKIFYM